ncbi:MAG: hypothetical protein IV104_03595 [Acidovorax sp.]|nr:hypothetical protein [Acidovorax sp.]
MSISKQKAAFGRLFFARFVGAFCLYLLGGSSGLFVPIGRRRSVRLVGVGAAHLVGLIARLLLLSGASLFPWRLVIADW